MPFDVIQPPPTTKPVTAGGGGGHPDTFAAKIPVAGGVPEQQANVEEQNAAAQQRQDLQAQNATNIKGAEQAEQAGAEGIPLADEHAAFVKQANDNFQARLARSQQEAERAMDEAATRKYENHWRDQSTGTKVLAGISSFLGGFGTGRPMNRAQEWIDRDRQDQQEEIARLFRIAEQKGLAPQHLAELQASVLRNEDAAYVGRLEAVKAKIEQQARRLGTEQARVNADKAISDFDRQIAAAKVKQAEDLRISASTHSLKGLPVPKGMRIFKRNGQRFWLNPATGQVQALIAPVGEAQSAVAAPAPAAPMPMPSAPIAAAPILPATQPMPVAQ